MLRTFRPFALGRSLFLAALSGRRKGFKTSELPIGAWRNLLGLTDGVWTGQTGRQAGNPKPEGRRPKFEGVTAGVGCGKSAEGRSQRRPRSWQWGPWR